ncbi:MAG: hemerythrin domain-containing protein [Pseudomonadota bacterium]|nr:hemerythrin domain-containing protein [Pseudomonadota bacterium]
MQPVSVYREQHKELLGMAEELRPLLNREQLRIRPVAKSAHTLLCEIAAKLKDHLANEDKELYPSLLTHSDLKVRSTAWKFISGEHSLRLWFEAYNKKWLKNCDFEFSDEFLKDTNHLLETLAARVEREERFLFPRLEGEADKEQTGG